MIRSIICLFSAIVLVSVCAYADVVYLKNGRKIEAEKVWEDGGQIKVRKYGSVIGYPMSAVERIEQLETPAEPSPPVPEPKHANGEKPTSAIPDGPLAPIETYKADVPKRSSACGVAFDGKHLWVAAQSVCDPDRFQKYSLDGKLLDTVIWDRGGNTGGGLTCDGKYLYNLNYNTNMGTGFNTIDKVTVFGELIDSTPAAGGPHNTFGLVWNGSGFFQGHSPTVRPKSTIYRLDANRNVIAGESKPFYTRGLAWDGQHLWASIGRDKKIYVLDRQLMIVKKIETTVPIGDIVWAGGTLWGIEHNGNRIHKLVAK